MRRERNDIMNTYRLDEELFKKFQDENASSGGSLDKAKSKVFVILNNELNKNQANVLSLYYINGLKQHDIAELLNKNQSTISRTLKRARLNLEKILKYLM